MAAAATASSMESASELAAAASGYKEQLEQVERLLLMEPTNAEYSQVRGVTRFFTQLEFS